jgi:TatD DNase family protein
MFIDSHCHLNYPEFSERMPAVLESMAQANVTHALCIGVDIPNFHQIKSLINTYDHLYGSVGVHPDFENTPEPTEEYLIEEAKHPKIIAIGETGLDYFQIEKKVSSNLEWQRERFRVHIRSAIATGKPLIIHVREAADDTLRILHEEGAEKAGGVIHCFTESLDFAKQAMDMGFYISFSGIVTFKNAKALQETCRQLPLDRILIETDSPFLAPNPYRGKVNEPAWVAHVGAFVADLRSISVEALGEATSNNFYRCFKLTKNQSSLASPLMV